MHSKWKVKAINISDVSKMDLEFSSIASATEQECDHITAIALKMEYAI